MKKDAQTLIEYILIFSFVAIVVYAFAAKFDFKTLRNYIFLRPATTSSGITKINIEPMTDGD